MRILSLGAYTLVVQYVLVYFIVAMGKPDWLMRINFVMALVTTVAYLAVARYGILYVAIAYTIVNAGSFVAYFVTMRQLVHVKFLSLARQTWIPIIACVVMASVLLASSYLFEMSLIAVPEVVQMVAAVGIGAMTYMIVVVVLKPSVLGQAAATLKTVRLSRAIQH